MKNLRALGGVEMIAFDPQSSRRKEVSDSLGVETVQSLSCAWKRKPDICLIATPTAVHLPIALEAAQQECDLFIEKPLSHDWKDVAALLDTVRRKNCLTLVGCNMRFHPGLATVKRLLSEHAVGRIVSLRVEAGQYLPDWHPWDDYRQSYSAHSSLGGGVTLDLIHEIDYLRWFGGEVAGVFCVAAKLTGLDIDTEDIAAILIRFDNGAVGEVHLDYVQRSYQRCCQIIGEDGTLYWNYNAGEVRWYSACSGKWQVFHNPPQWVVNDMYVDEMAHFLRSLDGNEPPALDVFEGAQVLRIALAAKQSAREQRWVELRSELWNPDEL